MCVVCVSNPDASKAFRVRKALSNPDIRIYITDIPEEALNVDYIWYLNETGEGIRISYTEAGEDLAVEFVDNKFYAGWVNKNHKLYKKLCQTGQ